MANIKSAKKRISTIERRRDENKFVKATMSTKIKKLRALIAEGKVAEAETYSKEVFAYINSACSKGVIHKNAASRKVGRLASLLFKANTQAPVVEAKVEKQEEVKVEEKVEVAEKPAKKTTTRKTTKTTEEKPAKKTTSKKSE